MGNTHSKSWQRASEQARRGVARQTIFKYNIGAAVDAVTELLPIILFTMNAVKINIHKGVANASQAFIQKLI